MATAHREPSTGRCGRGHAQRAATVVLAALTAMASAPGQDAPAAGVSRLKLRPTAVAAAAPLRLVDVLSFDEADAALLEAIGPQPVVANRAMERPDRSQLRPRSRVGATDPGQRAAGAEASDAAPEGVPGVVTHAQVVRRLAELGVNMARVLVVGAAECEIVQPPAAAAAAQRHPGPTTDRGPQPAREVARSAEAPESEAPLLRAVAGERAAVVLTLADALRERVQRELRSAGRAEVEFERAGGEFLALTAPPWEFNIRSGDAGKVGLREFSVALRRAGKTQRTVNIGANVKLLRPVLVARRPLAVGACIRDDDLAIEERLFESAVEPGFSEPAELIGQQVQRFVPAGELVKRSDVKAVDLVQRSRPVTVVGAGGGVALQVTGIALDAGTYGATVRVRLGETRKDQREVRGVVTGIATVRIAEGV